MALRSKMVVPARAPRPHSSEGDHGIDLMADHGFTGSYYSVRRFVRTLELVQELPFRRIECEPGDGAQTEFGPVAPVVGPDGKRRRTPGIPFTILARFII